MGGMDRRGTATFFGLKAVVQQYNQDKRDSEAAVHSTSHADVMERPRRPPTENDRDRVNDTVAVTRDMVEYSKASHWLPQA